MEIKEIENMQKSFFYDAKVINGTSSYNVYYWENECPRMFLKTNINMMIPSNITSRPFTRQY